MSDIYLSLTETPSVVTLSQPVVSGVLSSNVTVTNVVSVNVVTMPAITVQAAAPAVTTVAGTVAVSNFPASQVVSVSNFPASSSVTIANFPSVTTVAGTVALDSASLIALENVTVTVGAAVSVSNFPSTQTISGTVTATLNLSNLADGQAIGIPLQYNNTGDGDGATAVNIYKAPGSNTGGLPIQNTKNPVDESIIPLAISGTVTANLFGYNPVNDANESFQILEIVDQASAQRALPIMAVGSLPAISGTVTANLRASAPLGVEATPPTIGIAIGYGSDTNNFFQPVTEDLGFPVRITAQSQTQPISGTVTANSIFPRVTLIDGSGTVATANTAITVFASSSTRSYLLVQVTTGSAFVNVGATATTVNGINLTAGQGYSWETTIPQGIVSLISTTTNSRYVAKQA